MAAKKKPQTQSHIWKAERIVKLAIPTFILLGMIVGIPIWLYSTFAQAEDVQKKFETLQTTIIDGQKRSEYRSVISERRALEAEKRGLQREQFDILTVQERRKAEKKTLTDLEANRLKQVSEEVGRLDGEIKVLKDREIQEQKK